MKFIFCVALLFTFLVVLAQFNIGPYKTVWKLMEPCAKYRHVNLPSNFFGTWRKVNRTHFGFNGNLTLATDLDEQASAHVVVKKWGDGGWKIFFDIIRRNPCKFLTQYFMDIYLDVLSLTNKSKECPLTKGVYIWRNYVPKEDGFKLNFLMGDFEVTVDFIKYGVVQFCAHGLFTTTQLYVY